MHSTRRPERIAARASSESRASSSKSSGAPSAYQCPPLRTALQRASLENGTLSSAGPASLGKASAIALAVRLRTGEAAPNRPSALTSSPSSAPAAGTTPATRSVASVIVPVLSRQITSAAASDSTAFSCCTSAPRRVMRSAATANARLASRIRPSGMRVTTAAVAVDTVSSAPRWRRASEIPSAPASGTMAASSHSSRRLSASSSGERGWRKRRASPASRSA